MRILVIGLDSATPEILFGDEHLVNFQRIAEFGCFASIPTFSNTIPFACA